MFLEGVERVAMIEFNGIDIVVRHRTDDARVRRALAAALGVPRDVLL